MSTCLINRLMKWSNYTATIVGVGTLQKNIYYAGELYEYERIVHFRNYLFISMNFIYLASLSINPILKLLFFSPQLWRIIEVEFLDQ